VSLRRVGGIALPKAVVTNREGVETGVLGRSAPSQTSRDTAAAHRGFAATAETSRNSSSVPQCSLDAVEPSSSASGQPSPSNAPPKGSVSRATICGHPKVRKSEEGEWLAVARRFGRAEGCFVPGTPHLLTPHRYALLARTGAGPQTVCGISFNIDSITCGVFFG
jgi:hypothetical protein